MTLTQAEKTLKMCFEEKNISKANKLAEEAAGLFYNTYITKHPKAKNAELQAAYKKWYAKHEKKYFK